MKKLRVQDMYCLPHVAQAGNTLTRLVWVTQLKLAFEKQLGVNISQSE